MARKYNLYKHIRFNSTVEKARWDEEEKNLNPVATKVKLSSLVTIKKEQIKHKENHLKKYSMNYAKNKTKKRVLVILFTKKRVWLQRTTGIYKKKLEKFKRREVKGN